MWQDDPAILHCRSEEIKFRRDLGAGWQTRDEGFRGAWKKSRLHATRNRSLRRVHHSRNHDVFRLDIRNVHNRDCREAALLAAVSWSAFAESFSEESQVWIFCTRNCVRRLQIQKYIFRPYCFHYFSFNSQSQHAKTIIKSRVEFIKIYLQKFVNFFEKKRIGFTDYLHFTKWFCLCDSTFKISFFFLKKIFAVWLYTPT